MSSKECISLLAREYWYKGKLVTSCCCMFIGYSDNSWQKLLYNDEECIWEIENSEEVPDLENPEANVDFYYPYKSYLPEGATSLGALNSTEIMGRNKIALKFTSGLQAVFTYDPKSEKESIEINT